MQLNEQNFAQEVLKADGPVLVDFFATWCMSCSMMSPIIDKLIEDMKDTPVKIGKVDIDADKALMEKYEVLSIPTFIIFNKGQIVESMHGMQNPDVLKEKLMKLL
jgi:thioredoxin 1